MSNGLRLRDMKTQQRRLRSCSPTNNYLQYRNTVLKRANILSRRHRSAPLLPRPGRNMVRGYNPAADSPKPSSLNSSPPCPTPLADRASPTAS
ncbi:hypothetical protein BU26DRAFT_522302 [Trematosphaeria pertusa]|uniref:Uncharacterized protein n=1 Tax=Trematosphaeria pertusa TaxID=390896 RepID=A0A6A6I6Q7_9PLEO|nr:uncharacterized protein BU26DRAFT_522302 [Trematosphaeria pertusa]KAF2245203.1 hypothetical protein BU26DRAFT_522302 [Trematosphaeria pertusa]